MLASMVIMPSCGESKFSRSHLVPSRTLCGGFLVRMLSGFGRLPGTGDFPRPFGADNDELESERVGGTVLDALIEGFLCVIWLGSTLRRPAVTAEPLESWSKTAFMSVGCPLAELALVGGIGGGGGPASSKVGRGGGGGMPPEGADGGPEGEETWRRASEGSMPSLLFQTTPDGWCCLM